MYTCYAEANSPTTSPRGTRINAWMCSCERTGGCGPALTLWCDVYIAPVSLQLIPPVIFPPCFTRPLGVLRCHSWLRLSARNLEEPLRGLAAVAIHSWFWGLTVKENNQRMVIPHHPLLSEQWLNSTISWPGMFNSESKHSLPKLRDVYSSELTKAYVCCSEFSIPNGFIYILSPVRDKYLIPHSVGSKESPLKDPRGNLDSTVLKSTQQLCHAPILNFNVEPLTCASASCVMEPCVCVHIRKGTRAQAPLWVLLWI